MTTQEKNKAIAKWLGLDLKRIYLIETDWQPDKDRNQQKLIENKLIETGYVIEYIYNQSTRDHIYKIYRENEYVCEYNDKKDIALIDAVIELITQ